MQLSLKVGIIGFGKIGQIHWEHLKEIPEVECLAIAERASGSGWEAKIPSEIHCFNDWREMLALAELDAVIICLPHALHTECAEAAMQAGKHVFLEKPLATKLEDAQNLLRIAEENRLRLMVNMTHRFYPPLLRAKELLQQGVIGQVISVRDYYMEGITRSEFPAWFFDPELAGGGVAMTDSIHLVDRVSWLLEEPLKYAGGVGHKLSPESEVEDCAEILCHSASGIPITIGSFFFTGPKTWEDGLTLFGTKGVIHVQAWSHVEWRLYNGTPQREEGYSVAKEARALVGLRAALEEFIVALREGRETKSDGVSVLNAQEVIEAFYREEGNIL